MDKIFNFETTQFDFDFIAHVKRLREEAGLKKEELSLKMGLAKSFVGNVESYTQRHKYSTRHISLLAKAFGFTNISDLMQFPTPKNDKIRVIIKHTINETGEKNEIIEIESIS